jgi:hypothetical protein
VVAPAHFGEYNHNVKKPIEELEKTSQSRLLRMLADDSKERLKRDLRAFHLVEEEDSHDHDNL